MRGCKRYALEVYENSPGAPWPYDSIARLYTLAAQDNPILAADPDSLTALHASYRDGLAILYMVRDTRTTEHVGGVLAMVGDIHIRNCLCVQAAMIHPEHRGGVVSRMLHRAYLSFAVAAKLPWLCTTEYIGGGTYKTRYRRTPCRKLPRPSA